LVFAAGLFLRTFAGLSHRDLGLKADPVLLVSLDAQRSAAKPGERFALFTRVQEAVSRVPGVGDVAASSMNPVSGMGWNERVEIEGLPPLSDRESSSWMNALTPGWFSTYGTALLSGRDFDAHDRLG